MKIPIVVATSGGFDPLHIGHIRCFNEAEKLGDILVVMLNSDDFLLNKKGYIFMPYAERKEIIEALKPVDAVVPVVDKDMTVVESLEYYRPSLFVKGGDRTPETMVKSEVKICKKLGIEIRYHVGGDKIQSSSWLVENILKQKREIIDRKYRI